MKTTAKFLLKNTGRHADGRDTMGAEPSRAQFENLRGSFPRENKDPVFVHKLRTDNGTY